MEDNDAPFPKLKLKFYDEVDFYGVSNRGVHANQKISENDEIMFIPDELILTLEKVKRLPLC